IPSIRNLTLFNTHLKDRICRRFFKQSNLSEIFGWIREKPPYAEQKHANRVVFRAPSNPASPLLQSPFDVTAPISNSFLVKIEQWRPRERWLRNNQQPEPSDCDAFPED